MGVKGRAYLHPMVFWRAVIFGEVSMQREKGITH